MRRIQTYACTSIATTSVVQLRIHAVTRHYTLQYVELYIHNIIQPCCHGNLAPLTLSLDVDQHGDVEVVHNLQGVALSKDGVPEVKGSQKGKFPTEEQPYPPTTQNEAGCTPNTCYREAFLLKQRLEYYTSAHCAIHSTQHTACMLLS